MPLLIHRNVWRWILNRLIWDTGGRPGTGAMRALRATRKFALVVALTLLLTWREWVEHHPPEIAIVAVLHFLFVLLAIGLLVYATDWFTHRFLQTRQPKPPANDASAL